MSRYGPRSVGWPKSRSFLAAPSRRRLHCGRQTVDMALKLSQPPARGVVHRASILDAHRSKVDALLSKYPDLSAVHICEEIARGPDGYTGSACTLRRYLRTVRLTPGRIYQEVNYGPAQAMQVDSGTCGSVQVGSTTRKVSVFVAVLCYSRSMFIEFTLSQRKAEFYRGIVNALNFFGGSPRAIIFDNLKAGVVNGSGPPPAFIPNSWRSAVTSTCSQLPANDVIPNRRAILHLAPLSSSQSNPWGIVEGQCDSDPAS